MPARSRPSVPPVAWLVLLGVICALFIAHTQRFWRFTVDDAGITFTVAKNLADGHGLVLTPGGERVEAATNLLWCLALAPAKWFGGRHDVFAKVLGALGGCIALCAVAFFPSVARQRRVRYSDLLAPLGGASMALLAVWSVSGLENGLFAALLCTALVAIAHEEAHEDAIPWSAVLLGLLFATRPDGALYALCAGALKGVRLLRANRRAQDVIFFAVLGLMVTALELFRLAYFAWPAPNSFYTKRRSFHFGRDLFSLRNQGVWYIGLFLVRYRMIAGAIVVPFMFLERRAVRTHLALFAFLLAAFFFPVYSHGDWMEEFRFLSFAAPLLALGVAEGARALGARARIWALSRRHRRLAQLLPVATAAAVLALTTAHFPWRTRRAERSPTMELFGAARRARFFHGASRLLAVPGRASMLDPDIGGSSYDGRLDLIDLFGLGDVSIAHAHPNDPPGTRASIFGERHPTFIHLHGAWFSALELPRLEEMSYLYLPLPDRLPTGQDEPPSNWVSRASFAAPWSVLGTMTPDALPLDGWTVSHTGAEPGTVVLVDLTMVVSGKLPVAHVVATPEGGGAPVIRRALFAGGMYDAPTLFAGERPRARVRFELPRGRHALTWQVEANEPVPLGALEIAPGAGVRDARARASQLARHLEDDRTHEALRIARALSLRLEADPTDAIAREALGTLARTLAARARTLVDGGAYRMAASVARSAVRWAPDERRAIAATQTVGERLADAARVAERQGRTEEAFALAREAVFTDARRSWSRRRAEELRGRVAGTYDGARRTHAYRAATAAIAGTVEPDAAVIALGSVEQYVEAAHLAERLAHTPRDPRARTLVARGLLEEGEWREALALLSGVPCDAARDPDVTVALRALIGRTHRAGDRMCDVPMPDAPAPFDARTGSFESGAFAGWTVQGDAFGAGPANGRVLPLPFTNGWRGRYYAHSFKRQGNRGRGVLRSVPFEIRTDALSFLVGGGADPDDVGVQLLIEGTPVLRAAGQNDTGLRRVFWDVRAWRGRTAALEVYDRHAGENGYIMADDFREEELIVP